MGYGEASEWELAFNEESGRPVCFSVGGDIVPADELLARDVAVSEDGRQLLEVPSADGVTRTALEDVEVSFALAKLTLRNAAGSLSSTTLPVSGVIFQRKRNGCSAFLDGIDLYKVLKLDQYKKTPSKWVYNGHEDWESRLAPWLGVGSVVVSTVTKHADDVPFSRRCLHRRDVILVATMRPMFQPQR